MPSLRTHSGSRHGRTSWALALALGMLIAVPALAAERADAKARDARAARVLDERFAELARGARIPGLAVVVLRDTSVLLARGYGFADLERRIPMTVETPSNIASVSKPISAIAALRLVESGRLDLDRPLWPTVDFVDFCASTRGEPGPFFADFACQDSTLTMRHVLSMAANGQPGTRFLYNPPAYSWMSRAIAEAAGVGFSDLVDSLVLRAAGMTHSARMFRKRPLPASLADQLALPYHVDSTGTLVRSAPPPPQGDGAAGGVIASAMDLARLDRALTTDRLISPASRAQMWTPYRTASGEELPYGLGWFIADRAGRRLVWHTGLWDGCYSALWLKVPAEGLTLILLANSEGLQWPTRLDEAAIERSGFANAFLAAFPAARR
ncbi:MAG: serine hydrolase domain-containing protein [Candidatus Eisenbacteria bacterium]